jgi:hypothetical protein
MAIEFGMTVHVAPDQTGQMIRLTSDEGPGWELQSTIPHPKDNQRLICFWRRDTGAARERVATSSGSS